MRVYLYDSDGDWELQPFELQAKIDINSPLNPEEVKVAQCQNDGDATKTA